MSQSRLYSIIGNANVRRNMTSLNMASRESMLNAQVIDCVQMSALDTSLQEVRAESSILIIASLTEFILNNGDCDTILASIDPVLTTFVAKISNFCAYRPDLRVSFLINVIDVLDA